ncbi:MAG TPA: urate oxidase [Nocardioidaceae bacterium]|nr:urate oxidase [Nocardioidaceae bacterium]
MVQLGRNQYGKAQIRLMKVDRDTDRHVLHDLNVSVTLAGDLDAVHLHGDNTAVLPTDSQKNTVFAFAREHGVGAVEDFALLLARHFVTTQQQITRATVQVEDYPWERLGDHSFARSGRETRTVRVDHGPDGEQVVSGTSGLVLLNSTDSQFVGFERDRFTTLPEAEDRILCTAVDARWLHASPAKDWDTAYDEARSAMVTAFADTYSRSLQQTLFAMGQRLLESCPGVSEVRLSLPNRHHLLVDLGPFGLDNPNEVFHVDDRPYGLIEGTVLADGATASERDW